MSRLPTAEVLTIGDELLSGDTVNTNAAYLGQRCHALGLVVKRATVVRDRIEEIVRPLRAAVEGGAGVCLVCGGLGPTTDDLTAEATARAAGVELRRDDAALERLRAKFRALGRPMADANRKQADFPEGARVLPNPIGSAEGFALELRAGGSICLVFVMPGVPREMQKMMVEQVEPRLRATLKLRPIPRRFYRVLGMGESSVAQRIADVLAQARQRSAGLAAMFVHYRASMPEVQIILEATPGPGGDQASDDELRACDEPMREALDPGLYGIGDADLAPRLLEALRRAGLRIGTAESCTAGGTAARLAAVPGASDCLDGGIVAYDNRIKVQHLGVPERDLARHGAVSEPVARAMAEGARKALGSDLCVSITGIAGPSGGTPEKPVGTVHFAVADAAGIVHHKLRLRGDRGTVQRTAELWALKLVWDRLRVVGLAAIEEMSADAD